MLRPHGWGLRPCLAVLILGLSLSGTACTSNHRAESGECTFNGDCTDPLVCAAGFCRAQCAGNRDCPAGYTCNASSEPSKSVCLPPDSPQLCAFNSQCPANATCGADHACHPGCASNADCAALGPSATCTAGACSVPIHTPPSLDGGMTDAGASDAASDATVATDVACFPGTTYCADTNTCVDLMDSTGSCGACGHQCLSGQDCVGGVCTCGGGKVMCDTNRCADLMSDPLYCGTCGNPCAVGQACSLGHCVDPGHRWCGGSDVDLTTDPMNCGGCGVVCSGAPCVNGTCCQPGWEDCNGSCTDLRHDPMNCGTCGIVCDSDRLCAGGGCSLRDDTCDGARAVTLAPTGTVTTFTLDLNGATPSPNTCGPDRDVFFSITLTRTEIVEMDTFDGSTDGDARIGFLQGDCTSTGVQCSPMNGCQCGGLGTCPPGGTQLIETRAAGTYYFVVDSTNSGTGVTVNIRHIPVPSLNGTPLDTSVPSAVAAMGTLGGGATPACGALDDQWLYWASCPGGPPLALNVSICQGTADVTASLARGGASAVTCSSATCSSNFTASAPSGADIYVLSIDAANTGAYTLRGGM